jgi:hypothetical protein
MSPGLQNVKNHLFGENNPEEKQVEKPALFLSFLNLNGEKIQRNKRTCKEVTVHSHHTHYRPWWGVGAYLGTELGLPVL